VCNGGVSLTDVAFSSNSTLLAYGCDDGMVGIWHIQKKENLFEFKGDLDEAYPVRAVSFNVNDTMVAFASANGQIIVRSIKIEDDGSCKSK